MFKKALLFISLFFVLISLPLAVLAQDCFTSIGGGKVKVPCPLDTEAGPAGNLTFGQLVTSFLNIALAIVGSVAVAFLVYGGFRYITAHGNEEQTESAKNIMKAAIWGLIIVILSFVIINAIANALIGGREGVF